MNDCDEEPLIETLVGARAHDEDGLAVPGVPSRYAARLHRNADGTVVMVSTAPGATHEPPDESITYPPEGTPIAAIGEIDAAQIGMARLLLGLQWASVPIELIFARETSEVRPGRAQRLHSVHLDWTDHDTRTAPVGLALVTEDAETEYGWAGFTARVDESTIDVFSPGTVLRYLGEALVHLRVIVTLPHREERRALSNALVRSIAAERVDDRSGRRVTVPEYYRQQARYTLLGISRPDGPATAGSNQWTMEARVDCEISVVDLVETQALVRGVVSTVDARRPGA